jgi:cell division protein FtsQ
VKRGAPAAATAPEPARPSNRRLTPKREAAEPVAPRPKRPALRERVARTRARARAALERARRPLAVAGRVAAALVLAVGSVALARVLDRYVRTAPEFAVATLEIEGESRLTEAEITACAGIALGDNVFARSIDEVRADLSSHPWIAEATVERRLPSTFRITVRERVPAAILMLETTYLVSDEGAVFKSLEAGDPVDLPVITGVSHDRFFTERAYRTQLSTSIVGLLSEWQSAGMGRREPVGEVHVEPDESLTLFVGEDGTEVRLGVGPYRGKIDRLRRVLDELSTRRARPLYVYLDNVQRPDRVTVRVR